MKIVSIILVISNSLMAIDKSPDWIPAKYKKDFVDMVNACEKATVDAHAYAEVLRSPSQVTGCKLKDKGIILISNRGAVDVEWYAQFDRAVESCDFKNGTMSIKFSGEEINGSFMRALKYTAMIAGSIAIGYLLGHVSK